jgi:hypothetical protein
MLLNGDSEKYCIAVLILIRHYYNCVSEVLAVFRFCMRVIVLWLASSAVMPVLFASRSAIYFRLGERIQ